MSAPPPDHETNYHFLASEDSDADVLMGNSITGLLEGVLERTPWSSPKSTWEPPTEEELKHLFPAYQIECLLGRGGMGMVYKAYDSVLLKTVAIKLLPPLLAEDAQLMARFKREAHVMNSLDHPGIVKVHSFVQTGDGHAYFVMDYVEGKTIHELVAAKEISVKKTLRLVIQICKALQYLHDKQIIHRDIKPSNIIVDSHGNARLLDFGIAGQLAKGTENLTLTGQNPGTPYYIAPELYRGNPPTASSDIYSLGVTFYEMLTGERPRMQSPLPSKRSTADKNVDKVVLRALKESPSARYQNADEMRRDIQRCSRASREFRQAMVIASSIIAVAVVAMVLSLRPKNSQRKPVPPPVVETLIEPLPAPDQREIANPLNPPTAARTPQISDFDARKPGSISEFKLPGGTSMNFAYCPAGSFMMGSPPTEKSRNADLENQVPVTLSQGFWMAQMECTQGQWKAVMGETPRHFQGDNYPVFDMSWLDSQAFITKVATSAPVPRGWIIALPTAAQWEYASRAGTTTAFHFGHRLNGTEANCVGNNPHGTHEKGPSLGKTSLVGSYPPNAWGLFDMHGNVREWTADWYGGKLKGGTDPQGQPAGDVHSFRGGAWGDDAWRCRSARSGRSFGPGDDTRGPWYGFRIVLVADTKTPETAAQVSIPSPSPPADTLADFTATLRGYGWSYEDSLYPGSDEQPPAPIFFRPNGKFHDRWNWNYWIAAPGILHVQYWDPVYKPGTAVVLKFNEAHTSYSGQFKDEKGRLHHLSGTRLDPVK